MNFRFPEYLTIAERLRVYGKESLACHRVTWSLWTGNRDKERRSKVFNRLLHKKLTKINYPIINPKGNKTCDWKLVTSWRQEAGLTGLDPLTWHGWCRDDAREPNVYVAKQSNNRIGVWRTRLWTTCMGQGRDKLRRCKVSPLFWQELPVRRLDRWVPTQNKTRLKGTRGQRTS
jgi:hypothetical protein